MAAIPDGTSSQHRHKRVKLTTSVPAIPDTLPILPSSTPHTSKNATNVESESGSELSESSEEPSSESSSDEDSEASDSEPGEHDEEGKIVNLRANRGNKPDMRLKQDDLGPDIRGFLKDFLPQLKAANEELEEERRAGTLKSREIDAETDENNQGEQYIEMNLGLGVLEAKTSSASDSSDSDSEDSSQEKDIMGKLMGQERSMGSAGIQEVQEKSNT